MDEQSTFDDLPIWPGMPDPHRHNPLAVAVVLAVFGLAWAVVGGLVIAMICGVIG
jgi:hypothetical protein